MFCLTLHLVHVGFSLTLLLCETVYLANILLDQYFFISITFSSTYFKSNVSVIYSSRFYLSIVALSCFNVKDFGDAAETLNLSFVLALLLACVCTSATSGR